MTRICSLLWLSLIAAISLPINDAAAQQKPPADNRYYPLNQMSPSGVVSDWARKSGQITGEYFQPVKVVLPSTARVTFYEGSVERPHELAAPAQISLVVGHSYRLKISDVPEFPSIDFYPSIELIDRLHPPAGQVEKFPVEIELTEEELEWARDGRMMTKVVYLEQPNRIPVTMLAMDARIKTIEPRKNVIAEADDLGRPIAIVRIGGRTPDPNQPDPAFYGPGGPIRAARINEQAVKTNHPAAKTVQSGVFRIGPRVTGGIAQR